MLLMTTGSYFVLLGVHNKLCYVHSRLVHVHCRLQSGSAICKRVVKRFLSVNLRYRIILVFEAVLRAHLPIAIVEGLTGDII